MQTDGPVRDTTHEASLAHPIVTWTVVGSAWATVMTLGFGLLGAVLSGSPKHGLQLAIYGYFTWLVVGLAIVGPVVVVLWNRRTERRAGQLPLDAQAAPRR